MGPDAAAPQFASKFGVFLSSSFVGGFYSSSHFLGGTGYAFLDIRFLGGTGNGSLPSEFNSSFTCSWPLVARVGRAPNRINSPTDPNLVINVETYNYCTGR
ncbi:hypothetical protein PtA15_13A24 [Puccinia triticina]|uniref:Uncharacterized protein n=1 Tax=Puccinia triticina TaxID=208348 RepID=A0ABY7D2R2_9BASI|nr:uncharacterized protein PtA15_13A24 [Puccinia triticina]WAQ90626.1 hypothetical protein PtA15_13A24 [Puccinia triticina]WAR60783.1 hypothetical protein PtB15_13B27 [Puccinia triticina]